MNYLGIPPGMVYSDVYGWHCPQQGEFMSIGGPWDANPFYFAELKEKADKYDSYFPDFRGIFMSKLNNPYAAVEHDYVIKNEVREAAIQQLPEGSEVDVKSVTMEGSRVDIVMEITLPNPSFSNIVYENAIKQVQEEYDRAIMSQAIIDNNPTVLQKGKPVGKSTEVGANAINQLRNAIFEIEEEIELQERFDDSIEENGEIKASALIGIDMGIGPSKSYTAIVSPDGVTCKRCNEFNEYCTTPSESDGTHLCYRCRKGY